ncbi:MAG: relaxase/mobilization nuclease domain-containing protein [Methylobacter sp.]
MQKIKRGANPLGVFKYAIKGGPIIGGNMVGTTPRELAREFGQALKIREAAGKPSVGKPVWHNSLRLPAGERLSIDRWNQIANDYMRKMGFDDMHQRVIILHNHPEGQHIHIIGNRVSMAGGDLYLGQNENLKSTQIIKKLELDHNLTISPDNSECRLAESNKGEEGTNILQIDIQHHRRPAEKLRWTEPTRRRPTAGEVGMAERTGVPPARMRLQAAVDEACSNRPDLSEFVARLDKAGVSLIPSGKTGAPQGVSFKIDGQAFKGSDLGKDYAFKQLQGRIDFNIERDQHIIDRLRARALEEAQEEGGELVPAAPYPVATSAYKGPQRTLELAFKKEGETYRWAGRERVALIDKGQSISVMSKADSAIRASLQLARDKGWQSVMAAGTPGFRQKTWLIGREMGLQIDGYQPNPNDYNELQKRLDAKKREVKNGQNQSDDGSRRNRGSIQNQDSSGAGGVGRAPGNGADQPNRGDAGQLEREPDSGASHPGSRRNHE